MNNLNLTARQKRYQLVLSSTDTALVCKEIANFIHAINFESFDENTGLYLATSDAGIATSVNFWQDAITHGPGLVGPRLFPFTLANSPASCLTQILNIKGPCITLVGEKKLIPILEEMARDDYLNDRIKQALVIYLCLNSKDAIVLIPNNF